MVHSEVILCFLWAYPVHPTTSSGMKVFRKFPKMIVDILLVIQYYG